MSKTKRLVSFFLLVVLCAALVSPGFQVSAARWWDFAHISSTDGLIYPDIELHRNQSLQRWYEYDYSWLAMSRPPSFSSIFPEDFVIPDSMDAKITDTFINQLKQAFEYGVQQYAAAPESYIKALAVANALKSGDTWLDVFYKMEKAYSGSSWYNDYDTFDEYYLNYLLISKCNSIGLDENIVFSTSDSYDDIGKTIMTKSKNPNALFYHSNITDYKMDINDLSIKSVNITGYVQECGGSLIMKAYDANDNDIIPVEVVDRVVSGVDIWNGEEYPWSVNERDYSFDIPVKVGINKIRFDDGGEYNKITLTINVFVKPATANPTSHKVFVNGEETAFDAYNIDGNNYFKLRDLANVLSGTEKQFEVGWDAATNAVTLTSGKAYTKVGGEMTGKGSGNQTAVPTTSKIYLDGKEIQFTAYNIGGSNYFKLRDVGQAFDFGVDWDGAKNTIIIDTKKGYMPDSAPTPAADIGMKESISVVPSEKGKDNSSVSNISEIHTIIQYLINKILGVKYEI